MPPSRPNSKQAKPRDGAGGRPFRRDPRDVPDPTGTVVDPAWILKALALVLAVAVMCGYASFCLLFYQGQWQMVLHPTHDHVQPGWERMSAPGAGVQKIHFGPDASGTPQMVGWWIPADPEGRFRHLTALYLPTGDGQVATADARIADLHKQGLNVFAFDYRGYGESGGGHPNEERMREDAAAALGYLGSIRGVATARTIPYGAGVGASLAITMAQANPTIPAVILDHPVPDLLERVAADPRDRILPVRWLFKERFPVFPALGELRTPKLILITSDSGRSGEAMVGAAGPKFTLTLNQPTEALDRAGIARFLDLYAPPTPAPQISPATSMQAGR